MEFLNPNAFVKALAQRDRELLRTYVAANVLRGLISDAAPQERVLTVPCNYLNPGPRRRASALEGLIWRVRIRVASRIAPQRPAHMVLRSICVLSARPGAPLIIRVAETIDVTLTALVAHVEITVDAAQPI